MRLARAMAFALLRGERRRGEVITRGLADARTELAIRRELDAPRFRSTRPVIGSDHPGASWPPTPRIAAADPLGGEAMLAGAGGREL
jgi:hypothetical protein